MALCHNCDDQRRMATSGHVLENSLSRGYYGRIAVVNVNDLVKVECDSERDGYRVRQCIDSSGNARREGQFLPCATRTHIYALAGTLGFPTNLEVCYFASGQTPGARLHGERTDDNRRTMPSRSGQSRFCFGVELLTAANAAPRVGAALLR